MNRQDYLKELFQKIKETYCIDVSTSGKWVKFGLENKRQNKNVHEAFLKFEEMNCLIKIKRDGN